MIHTIVAALVVAVAAIAGMLFLARWMLRYQYALRQQEIAQVEISRHYDEKVEFLQRELFYAKQANSIRDSKTGRFISAEEKLRQRRESYCNFSLPKRTVAVTAGVDVAGPRIETTVVGWGRDGKPAWKE